MPRRFSRPPDHEDLRADERRVYSPDVSRVLALAFGIAALVGLATGVLWVAWNLVRAHLLP
jgi:hypothetical protein